MRWRAGKVVPLPFWCADQVAAAEQAPAGANLVAQAAGGRFCPLLHPPPSHLPPPACVAVPPQRGSSLRPCPLLSVQPWGEEIAEPEVDEHYIPISHVGLGHISLMPHEALIAPNNGDSDSD